MKLRLIDRSSLNNSCFTIKKNQYPHFLKIWHYHTEMELAVILESTGTRFIGDNIEKFEKGEIVLLGENLPHMWLNDDTYFNEPHKKMAEAIAIHFKIDFLGAGFFDISEMKHIAELLDKAKYGINFKDVDKEVIYQIKSISSLDGFERTIKFIEILNSLAKHKKQQLLASKGFVNTFHKSDKDLNKIYEFIFNNFKLPIGLQEVASIACMNPASFSRFFKRVNRKTFTRYLNEIRIGYACKLLMERKFSITTICYESGFNNVSNFNRQFKKINSLSPTEYLKEHRN